MVKFLLESGADANNGLLERSETLSRDEASKLPLAGGIVRGADREIIEALVAAGAMLNGPPAFTPLT